MNTNILFFSFGFISLWLIMVCTITNVDNRSQLCCCYSCFSYLEPLPVEEYKMCFDQLHLIFFSMCSFHYFDIQFTFDLQELTVKQYVLPNLPRKSKHKKPEWLIKQWIMLPVSSWVEPLSASGCSPQSNTISGNQYRRQRSAEI